MATTTHAERQMATYVTAAEGRRFDEIARQRGMRSAVLLRQLLFAELRRNRDAELPEPHPPTVG